MSVALMISGKDDSSVDVFVPIASQAGFREVCVPLATELGLRWMPLFEVGCVVPPQDVGGVVQEFERLRHAVLLKDPSLQAFSVRLDRVIDALKQYTGREDVEVSIG